MVRRRRPGQGQDAVQDRFDRHLRPHTDRSRPLQPRTVLAVEAVGVRPERRQRRGDGRRADDPARTTELDLSKGGVVAGLQTEYSFTLPKGYIDGEGNLHRHGSMRLATARDEIEPLRDADINSADDPYLTILVLARVITELGTLSRVT